MSSRAETRILGLDVARSLAILLVLIAHFSLLFSARWNVAPILYGSGYFGVELFFALSGFLIGGIVIRTVLGRTDWRSLRGFWIRRWMRTLPAYYLVLAGLAVVTHAKPRIWFLFAFFLQNFTVTARDSFFGVAWSLAIEEWFYLLLPVAVILLSLRSGARPARLILGLCVFGILACLAARMIEVAVFHTSWMEVRKSIFQRMDALLFGMLLAALKHFWPEIYAGSLRRFGGWLGALGFAGWAVFAFYLLGHPGALESYASRTIMFSVVSACAALIVAWLDTSRFCNERLRATPITPIAYAISVTSYSVYLIHWDVMLYAQRHLPSTSFLRMIEWTVIGLAITYGLATLVYGLWERPMMRLRERLPAAKAARFLTADSPAA